jgi:hypothetical protein
MIQLISVSLVTILFTVIILLNALRVPHMFMFYFIKGAVIGALYDSEEYPDEDIVEHTVQIAFLFCTFTYIWETQLNNSNNNYAS